MSHSMTANKMFNSMAAQDVIQREATSIWSRKIFTDKFISSSYCFSLHRRVLLVEVIVDERNVVKT